VIIFYGCLTKSLLPSLTLAGNVITYFCMCKLHITRLFSPCRNFNVFTWFLFDRSSSIR